VSAPRIAVLRQLIENLTDAIASGALKASPALTGQLAGAEAELAELSAKKGKAAVQVLDLPARLAGRFQKLVERLEDNHGRDPHRTRAACTRVSARIRRLPSGETRSESGFSQRGSRP